MMFSVWVSQIKVYSYTKSCIVIITSPVAIYFSVVMRYHSVPGKCLFLGRRPCNFFGCSNGKCPLPSKRPGNMSQDRSNDKAEENTYEDGDVDDLNPFSDSDE